LDPAPRAPAARRTGVAFRIHCGGAGGCRIYSLLTYIAIQKQREISIRVALWARPMHIRRIFSQQMLLLLIPGVFFGLASAFVAGRWIQSLLYGIEPTDPVSLATATIFLCCRFQCSQQLIPFYALCVHNLRRPCVRKFKSLQTHVFKK
jgi:hypothetical protein